MPRPDPMAEIRASFFVECEELLESLQDALGAMEDGTSDAETINIVFRAVHSIKGGAGAFGLDALVAFAHRYETVMDEVRSGRLAVTPEALKLFFRAADTLADEVRAARDGRDEPAGAAEVLTALEALTADENPRAEDSASDFVPLGLALDLDLGDPLPDGPSPGAEASGQQPLPWVIRFRPSSALYTSGNEPLFLLRALAELGECTVRCETDDLGDLQEVDPEAAVIGWTIRLPGRVAETDIRAVFDFVEDVCSLDVTRETDGPPSSGQPAAPDVAGPAGKPAPTLGPIPAPVTPAPPSPGLPAGNMPDRARQSEEAAGAPSLPAPPAPAASPAAEASATVRVDLDRIDRLVNLVGELVINQAMLAQSVAEAGLPANSQVMSGLEDFMILTRDIQDSVMMIRAQPVKPLFQRMARIVREASAAVGKTVRLRTEGEATEIDKTVIERLADPLTHMIRNAVDHGLESPADRAAAGKPAEGVVTLRAQHRSGRVVIEIADDGAGIDRQRVREIAVRKGLIPADAALTDAEIDNLLFLPGFSTAGTVSSLSGRGVGMDVVKRAIQGLGGRIAITSERGRGTNFSISLPLTLAVLDGMVVQVEGQTLVLPLSSVVETAILTEAEIMGIGRAGHVVHLRGDFVPLVDLGVELGYRHRRDSYVGGIVLLTVTEEGSRAALVVDTIVEQRQVVIKGLQPGYGNVPGIAAATILGDGQIALILDPAGLARPATSLPPSLPLAG